MDDKDREIIDLKVALESANEHCDWLAQCVALMERRIADLQGHDSVYAGDLRKFKPPYQGLDRTG